MAKYCIQPSRLQGSLVIPPSKSHTLRAILFSALAKGHSQIENFLPSPDTNAMIDAVRQLGARVQIIETRLEIEGTAGILKTPSDVIQCGNSGIVLRFIGAIAGLLSDYTILTGDSSIRENRPVQPLLDAATQLGAFAVSSRGNKCAPILIKGPFTKFTATLDGRDSQPVSGLLIAAAFAPHPIELHVTNPGEKPWIEMTLYWLRRLKIPYLAKDYTRYQLEGNAQITGFTYTVPGDFSTAAFPIAAALLTNSEVTIRNIDMNDCQGDKKIVEILERMGAQFSLNNQSLTVHKGVLLHGVKIDIDECIDALPILAVIGCFAKTPTEIYNGAIARKKESDRIRCIAENLRKMGAKLEEKSDGLIVYPSQLNGADLNSHADHRLALSLSVAALAATGSSQISGVECIAKTYPDFYQTFTALGAQVEYGL